MDFGSLLALVLQNPQIMEALSKGIGGLGQRLGFGRRTDPGLQPGAPRGMVLPGARFGAGGPLSGGGFVGRLGTALANRGDVGIGGFGGRGGVGLDPFGDFARQDRRLFEGR